MRDKKVVLVESGDEEQIEETLVEGNVPRLCRTRSMLAMLPIFARSFMQPKKKNSSKTSHLGAYPCPCYRRGPYCTTSFPSRRLGRCNSRSASRWRWWKASSSDQPWCSHHFVLSLDGGNSPDDADEGGCYQVCKAHFVETTLVDVQRTKGCEYEVNADLLRAARRGLGARKIPQRFDSWADDNMGVSQWRAIM